MRVLATVLMLLGLMACVSDLSVRHRYVRHTPTGRCVFFQDPMGQACSSSFVSVGCAAQNTCVAGQCRKTCYCDSDCAQGQTCSDASGPCPAGAFKLCR
jgi:hypothetical protein